MQKIRLGVIGTGAVVREIYQHLYFSSDYSHLLSVEAAADPNDTALNEFCDKYNISPDRRFEGYDQMMAKVELDAVAVNTPDRLHEAPVVAALERGLDVLVAKPLADTIQGAHHMIQAMQKSGRLIGVDFHKRDDPRIKQAMALYQSGQYGSIQSTVWWMMDKLMVVDPNHVPRFFASADFAEKNSPVSFLTVHIVDALICIVNLKPVKVRTTGYKQKLPSLAPLSVNGYDLCDTEVELENGGVGHFITGWHLPNSAYAMTVQSSRMVCTDGMIDLGLDTPGYLELSDEGTIERNPLFRSIGPDGNVTGYGMLRPGRILQKFLKERNGELSDKERAELMDPMELGFWTTVVCDAARQSLEGGTRSDHGVVRGVEIDVRQLLEQTLSAAAGEYV